MQQNNIGNGICLRISSAFFKNDFEHKKKIFRLLNFSGIFIKFGIAVQI